MTPVPDSARVRDTNWRPVGDTDLPDFIIGGAMKCGTTTIHEVLSHHPDVFIPDFEVGFFNIDDLRERDVNYFDVSSQAWTVQDMAVDPDAMWRWYRKWFAQAGGRLKGEDSATYLASPFAAERIGMQSKPIKLIFSLHHPTDRLYSHYFHLLRRGRAMFELEDMLRYQPKSLIDRSLYTEQLRSFYSVIDAARIRVVLFEDMVERPVEVFRDLCEFLELDFAKLPESALTTHGNRKARYRYTGWRAFENRLLRRHRDAPRAGGLPFEPPDPAAGGAAWARAVAAICRGMNPRIDERAPPMADATRRMLDGYFRKRLDGLDDLVGRPVLERWFS